MPEILYKLCGKCLQYLPATSQFFPKDIKSQSGISSPCKICKREKAKTRLSTQENRDKRNARIRQRRQENPKADIQYKRIYRKNNRDKIRQQDHVSRLKNPEKYKLKSQKFRIQHPNRIKESTKKWIKANPERRKTQLRKWTESNRARVNQLHRIWASKNRNHLRIKEQNWRKANPGKAMAQSQRHRAHKYNAEINNFTAQQWQTMQAAYDHRCVYCEKRHKGRLTQDHITPLSQGGNHTLINIIPACRSCNSKKHTGSPIVPIQPLLL